MFHNNTFQVQLIIRISAKHIPDIATGSILHIMTNGSTLKYASKIKTVLNQLFSPGNGAYGIIENFPGISGLATLFILWLF